MILFLDLYEKLECGKVRNECRSQKEGNIRTCSFWSVSCLREAARASLTSAPGTGTGEALFDEGRRAALELRVESRGEAAARAVAPRDKVGDTVWEGGEDTRFDADGLDLDDVVAMS